MIGVVRLVRARADARAVALTLLVVCPLACDTLFGPKHPTSLAIRWVTPSAANSAAYWQGRPAVDGGRVFTEEGNSVVAFDAGTGRRLWARPVRIAPYPPPTALLAANGRVYISEVDSVLSMDEATGATIWNFHPDSQAIVMPAMDDQAFYTGQRGIPVVYALALSDGHLLWRTNLGVGYQYPALVGGLAVHGDTVYATAWRWLTANGYRSTGVLVALSRLDGHELWRYETAGQFSGFRFEPLIAGSRIIVDDVLGGLVVAVDVATQLEAWHMDGGANGSIPSAPSVLARSGVYSVLSLGYAMGVDTGSGNLMWRQANGSSGLGVVVCGSSVFTDADIIQRRDLTTGRLTGELDPKAGYDFSSNFASDGHTVYVTGGVSTVAIACQ
jgi:outer membrane protein assembly factor BamB